MSIIQSLPNEPPGTTPPSTPEPGVHRPDPSRPVPEAQRVQSLSTLDRRQRIQFIVLVAIWLALSANFWIWWLNPIHVGNVVLYTLVSLSWFYIVTALPSLYMFLVGHMRTPVSIDVNGPEQAGVIDRVSVITLTVPGSESLNIVRRQLVAMSKIRYPHDSWILVDSVHSPEIEQLAAENGVNYFSRHDVDRWGPEVVARWNDLEPPFQMKTKAGNVNSWLDAFGDDYTHFTQLDIDHNPVPDYLDRVLGFFIDPRVGWVQAPSVYGNHEAWTSRGATEQELVLQGPLQQGFYGYSDTPFIIGSHCTYDMVAIQSIGGFQPTRAEDHLDTVCLAAEGYRGVFYPEIIAVGDGPETFDTYLAQQFAWAYSMFQVLFKYTPKLIRSYTRRQAVQCLFVQTWYLSSTLSILTLFATPLIALAFDVPISHVSLWTFYLHSVPLGLMRMVVWAWSWKWFSPRGIWLSWRGIVLHAARWVIVLSALIQVILKVQKPYMITVKGMGSAEARPYRMKALSPYVALILVSLAVCWLFTTTTHGPSSTQGLLFFALLGALMMWIIIAVVVIQDFKSQLRTTIDLVTAMRLFANAWAMIAILAVAWTVTALASYGLIIEAFKFLG